MEGFEKQLKYNILLSNTNIEDNRSKLKDKLEIIKCDHFPMCSECLFEIKDGIFICNYCKVNLCEVHLTCHNKKYAIDNNSISEKHIIFRLEK